MIHEGVLPGDPSGEPSVRGAGAGAAVASALRFALGTPAGSDASLDWGLVFTTASRELLAPLAWLRSGPFIRRHGEPFVAAAWRRAYLAAQLRGQQQLEHLGAVLAALEAARVRAVVLKGLPLGRRLYGDPFVRCSADVDLFVPAAERARAAAELRELGWIHEDGGAPWHESWSLRRGEREHHLELHSSLVSDHLAHLPVPAPAAVDEWLDDIIVRAHGGPSVAPYLAAHLATHQMPPLLWLVDFATLWAGLSLEERVEAERVADDARLSRYLEWARERSALIEPAASADAASLRRLGVGSVARRDIHSIWRHLSLAASAGDALRVGAAFLVPRRVRGDLRALCRYTIARLRTRLASLAGTSRRYSADSVRADAEGVTAPHRSYARALRLERADMIALARDVVGAGSALRVRTPGGSMLPTIPRGALVRIGGVPPDGITVGTVVLALTNDGEPVIHRVVAMRDGVFTTRGDAALTDDPPLPSSRVIGVATHVEYGGVARPLGRRPVRSIAISALKLRRRIARVVRRGR